jgi:hypothetical protein
VLAPGAAFAAGSPQPDLPPTGLLVTPQPESPPARARPGPSSAPAKPPVVERAPDAAVRSSPTAPAVTHPEAARHLPGRAATTTVAAPTQPREAPPEVEPRLVLPLPLVASLHPEEPAGGGGSLALVALAGALLALAAGSLALTVTELRRGPA